MAGYKTLLTLVFIGLISLLATGCGGGDDNPTTTAPVVDTAPPGVPNDPSAEFVRGGDETYVLINWADNTTDADFAGFQLSRINSDNTVDLTQTLLTDSTYRDYGAPTGTNIYEIAAVDLVGNISAAVQVYVAVRDIHVPQPDIDY